MSKADEEIAALKTKVNSLEERTLKIDNYFRIAFVVAVVFGLTGSWGAWLINTARNNINDLNQKISSLVERSNDFDKAITKGEKTIASAVADGEIKLRGKADSLADGLIWSEVSPKGGYIRIGNMQICWDSFSLAPEKSPNHHHIFLFPAAFVDEPIITPGINPQGNGEVYSVSSYTLGKDQYKMDIAEAQNREKPMTIEMSYVAIGRWR